MAERSRSTPRVQSLLPHDDPQDTPFGRGFTLGRWLGVPVRAHWSVLVAVVLFAALLASVQLPSLRPGMSAVAYWVAGAITALVFFGTLMAHELAHAVVARHYGLRVRRINLWLLGGLTELDGELPSPRADALVAGSGPAVSLALGGVFGGLAVAVGGGGLVAPALGWLGAVNVLLGVFNLLPGAPLDGGRLLRALLWWRSHDRVRSAEQAAGAGRVLGMVLIALGLVQALLVNAGGLWTALVGWFIIEAAASERYAGRAERLHGLTVRDAMTATPVVVPGWWTVEQFQERFPTGTGQVFFPLVDTEGLVSGAVTSTALEMVPAYRADVVRLSEVAPGPRVLLTTSPDDDLSRVLLHLHVRGGLAFVVEDGHPVGVLTEDDLARVARVVGDRA